MTRMANHISLFVVICGIFFYSVTTFAENPTLANGGQEPQIEVKKPPSYSIHKVLLFPLDIPAYAIRAVTWPIGAGLSELEKHGIVDKALNFLSNDEKTFWFYPIIEGGAGTGFGGGIGFKHTNLFHKKYAVGGSYTIHINMDQRASFFFGKPDAFKLLHRPISYIFGTKWNRITGDDFYGIGPESSQSNHSQFLRDEIVIGVGLPFEAVKHFTITPFVAGSLSEGTAKKYGSDPNVTDTFPPGQLPGYGRWLNYIDFGLQFLHDTRGDPNEPKSGGTRKFVFHRFQCVNAGGFDYNQYVLDLRQYIALWKPRQILVLHAGWEINQETGGGAVPFWRLATLDAGNLLRGFSRGRFQDLGKSIFNIEYRFPVWDLLGGTMFVDGGRVFHHIQDFAPDNFKYSVGGGINLRAPGIALFHFEMAYGGEGINTMFGISSQL